MMRKRGPKTAPGRTLVLVLALATLVVALGLAPAVASGHITRFNTQITLRFTDNEGEMPGDPDLEDDFFSGRVSSPKPACERRTVEVFRNNGGAPDDLLGITTSNTNGAWSLLHEDPGDGIYYARVDRKDIGPAGHQHRCRAATSGGQNRFVNDSP